MKKIIIPLFIFMLAFYLNTNAKKENTSKFSDIAGAAVNDSIYKKFVTIGDIFIVENEYKMYTDKKELATESFLANGQVTLKPGTRFKVFEVTRVAKLIVVGVVLPDNTKAYIINLPAISKYCYKEGEQTNKAQFTLHKLFEFRTAPFWYFLLTTISISILFLIFFSKINKLIANSAKRHEVESLSGWVFLGASAIFGALTGVTFILYTSDFKEFILHLPQFSFPSEPGFLLKFYWFLQPLFLLFFGFVLYRYIRLYGPKFGIIGSIIMLIPAFAIFWSSMMLSFLVVLGAIIALILLTTGSMASDTIMKGQSKTVIRDQMGSSGEISKVEIKYDSDGHVKSRRNI